MNEQYSYRDGEDNSFYFKSNFGKKGWLLIIFVGILMYFCAALTNDGMNVAVPAIADEHGWNYATILAYSTPAGFISVIGFFFLSMLADRKGAKFVTILCVIATALSTIWLGNATSQLQYFIALTCVSVFVQSCAWIGGGSYLAHWFPNKKGLALGWATMGTNLASATIIPILTGLMGLTGSFAKTTVILGVVIAVTVVFCFFLPNYPEEKGLTPDNLPMTQEEINTYRKNTNNYKSPWTIGKILKSKETWLIILVLGIILMITAGIMSQLVTRLTGNEIGWSQTKAIGTMSVVAIIGIVGSYIWGWLDQKIGTKKIVSIFMIWFGIAILMNTIPSTMAVYISLFMIGLAIGGCVNWPVSLVSSTFGYLNFTRVYSVIMPLYTMIRCCAYLVLAFFIGRTGSLSGAYVMFAFFSFLGSLLCWFIKDENYTNDFYTERSKE